MADEENIPENESQVESKVTYQTEEQNESQLISVKTRNGIEISKNAIIITIALSLAYLLVVGLISGLVFRNINKCETADPQPNQQETTKGTTTTKSATTTTTPSLPSTFDVLNVNLKMNVRFLPYLKSIDQTGFSGNVDITFGLAAPTSEILFNAAKEIVILEPILITNLATNAVITVLKAQHRPINDSHLISLPSSLSAGYYKLSISFDNNITSLYGNRGIFAREYLDDLVQR